MKPVRTFILFLLISIPNLALGELESDPPAPTVRSIDEFDGQVARVSWAAQKVLADMRVRVEWVSAGGDSMVFVPLKKNSKLIGLVGSENYQSPDSFWGEDTGSSVVGGGGVAKPEPQAGSNEVGSPGPEMSAVDGTVHGILLALKDMGSFSTLATITPVKRVRDGQTNLWSDGAWSRDFDGIRYPEGDKLALFKRIHGQLGDKYFGENE